MTLTEQASRLIIQISSERPLLDSPVWEEVDDLAKRLRKKPEPPGEPERVIFNEFRVAYKRSGGAVRGVDIEMKELVKHKDWPDILLELSDHHQRQIKERRAMADAGLFVPEWPHLKTYINQRKWEMEYYGVKAAVKAETSYTEWLRKQAYRLPFDEVSSKAMTEKDFLDYTKGSGKFEGIDLVWPLKTKKKNFVQLHAEYFNSLYYRAKYPTVTEYIKTIMNGTVND